MAIFRNVNMSFWTDTKIVDDYTPEDRYFMLWILTNNYTNIIGCYEVSLKQISRDLGYDSNSNIVENLVIRFINIHKTIDYDFETKELFIKNWYKYNWNASPKLNPLLLSSIDKIKSDIFHDELSNIYNQRETVIEKIPYRYGIEKKQYPIDTTIPISIPITSSISSTIAIAIPISNTITNNNIINDDFESLWSLYPRKQGKTSALKSYKKAIKNGVDNQTILNGINNYLNYIRLEKIETQYIKQGSTWFNNNCWEDDYVVKKKMTTKDIPIDISDF